MREAFHAARESDSTIEREIKDGSFANCAHTLSLGKGDILSMFPKPQPMLLDFGDTPSSHGLLDTSALEAKLMEMAGLIHIREKAVAAVKDVVETDLTDALVRCVVEGGDPTMICDQHVALCDESIAAVARSKSRQVFPPSYCCLNVDSKLIVQDELLPEIFDANDRWIRARQQDPLSIEKDGVISSIEQSATRFINLHAQLSAGITFYSNLQVFTRAAFWSANGHIVYI